jgi:hypothetical protein
VLSLFKACLTAVSVFFVVVVFLVVVFICRAFDTSVEFGRALSRAVCDGSVAHIVFPRVTLSTIHHATTFRHSVVTSVICVFEVLAFSSFAVTVGNAILHRSVA